jgi:predicted amidohydrolase YtcJ
MNPFNPFLTIYAATTRRTESGRVVSGAEAVSREEALKMMTRDAARLSFDESHRGSIESGKLGDFVILDDDVLTCSDQRLRTLGVDVTVVGGRVVFERAARK